MGREKETIKVRLLWNMLNQAEGNLTKAIENSGLPRRSAYLYIDYMLREGSIRRLSKHPAVFSPTPAGAELYQIVPGAPPRDSCTKSDNSCTTPFGWGRATLSHADPSPDPAPAPSEAPQTPQDEPSNPTLQYPAPAGSSPTQADSAPSVPLVDENPERARPAPPIPLDYPARHHHIAVLLRVTKRSDRTPQLELVQWGPMKNDSHGQPWYRQADVLLDFGTITLQDFGSSIRLWLPERTVNTRQDLEDIMQETTRRALRVSNWLSKQYGYQFALPELEVSHVGFHLPEGAAGGKWKGWLKVQCDDGTWVTIDKSKGYAELEILIRASQHSMALRTILSWANAPTLLGIITDQVQELKQTMPQLVQASVMASVAGKLPDILKSIPPAMEAAIQAPAFMDQLRAQIRSLIEQAFQETVSAPSRPFDGVGYL